MSDRKDRVAENRFEIIAPNICKEQLPLHEAVLLIQMSSLL
jgi:hypothetical protein